nr:hypothetical protein [uncultured Pseudomonas sp.]
MTILIQQLRAEIEQLKAENTELKSAKHTIECRFEVSEDTLSCIRGCLRAAESDIDKLKAENAELRQDKARLDRGYIMTGVPGVNACEHRGMDLRAAIDRVTQLDEQRAQGQAMTKEQP